MDNFDISIKGLQSFDGESDEVIIDTTGNYAQKGDTKYITYKEYDEEIPTEIKTSIIKIEGEKVTLIRPGSSTRLILEKGKRHRCLYDTGYGPLTIGIFTTSLSTSLDNDGGNVNIKYTLDIDSTFSSTNELDVSVRPSKTSFDLCN